jgi:N-acyl amino acid synthase of PEP-CTERM/exosortase system
MSSLLQFGINNAESAAVVRKRKPADLFKKYLTVMHANSRELLDAVFRLRFQVYCLERGFEDAAAHPDGRERDEDDARSLHFVVLYRPMKARASIPAGTVRLILPRRGIDLPVLRLLSIRQRRRLDLPLTSTAEVSRFAVPREFRKRLTRDLSARPDHAFRTLGGAREAPNPLSFLLLRAVVTMTADQGITHILAMMEPPLLRLLGRLGIEFHPIGGMVEHHGLRQPVWGAMSNIIQGIKRHRPEVWDVAFEDA